MSQLLRIRLVDQDPRVLHGRRGERRSGFRPPTDSREGPLWCGAAPAPGQPQPETRVRKGST